MKNKHVAVIGLGSGGSAVADMLARAGVGKLALVDPDKFETEMLPRHIMRAHEAYEYDIFNTHKVTLMERHILDINPKIRVETLKEKFDDLPAKPDLVACCADSDLCCQLVNAYSLREGVPVVYGSVWGAAETAEIITVIPGLTPCYACYEREGPEPEPSQEKYTNPDYDATKMPHQEGLWCDVLMAASIQFRAILGVLEFLRPIPPIWNGCSGAWKRAERAKREAINSLILASLRPPYGAEVIKQKKGCAVCSENFEGLCRTFS